MKIGIIGCGAIGITLAKAAEEMDQVTEVYVWDRTHICSARMQEKLSKAVSILTFEELLSRSDMILEAASQEAVQDYAGETLRAGKDILIMSVGALVDDEFRGKLEETARKNNARIYLPTGAVCGVDGLNSASVGGLEEVILTTTKPPNAFEGVDYLKKKDIDLDNIKEPTTIFEGLAKEAVRLFPKNVNVAATVSIAGIGFDKTMVKIVADPGTDQNRHEIAAKGAFGSLRVEINNLPFERNPKTSRIAALSAVAALKKIVGTYWVGV